MRAINITSSVLYHLQRTHATQEGIMDKELCEKLMLQALELAVTLYHSYNPDGKYLNLYYREDQRGRILNINNAYWRKGQYGEEEDGEDIDKPIRVWIETETEEEKDD